MKNKSRETIKREIRKLLSIQRSKYATRIQRDEATANRQSLEWAIGNGLRPSSFFPEFMHKELD